MLAPHEHTQMMVKIIKLRIVSFICKNRIIGIIELANNVLVIGIITLLQ